MYVLTSETSVEVPSVVVGPVVNDVVPRRLAGILGHSESTVLINVCTEPVVGEVYVEVYVIISEFIVIVIVVVSSAYVTAVGVSRMVVLE